MLMKSLTTASIAAISFLAPLQGLANSNNALYGTAIPEDAVFVRWLAPTQNAEAFGAVFDNNVSESRDYVPVSGSALNGAEPGRFYTVTKDVVIAEPARDDASKVHLILLNAASDPARLVVTTNDAEVIGATVAGQAQARGVNPVSAELSVVTDTETLATFEVNLRRGQNLTFAVEGDGAYLIENAFAPVAELN